MDDDDDWMMMFLGDDDDDVFFFFFFLVDHPDLIQCRKQAGIAIGRMCEKCDGKCPICDSYVRPQTLVRICDECNFGTYGGRCIICGSPGISDAYYCE